MAKRFVKITLAAKCRVLFGAAIFLIIAAALIFPWLYIQAMFDEESQRAGGEVSRMYLSEWTAQHHEPAKAEDVARLFTAADESGVRRGPTLLLLKDDQTFRTQVERSAQRALRTFLRDSNEDLVQIIDTDDQGRRVYRSYRAVRAKGLCLDCHGDKAEPQLQLKPLSLVGLIRTDLPGEAPGATAAISRPVLGRLVIILAGLLAFLLATLTFYFITQKLILSPVRKLKDVADRAAEGDLTVRSEIRTGDEFEQFGRSFDGMLQAVTETQNQLRAANRALDLKLNELAEANVALFESNRVKTEFLANVSHELRTPLNSIIGFADLLLAGSEDERTRGQISNILTSGQMLLKLIDDLLNLARIEAGKVSLTVTGASVQDICETLVSLVTPLATKKNLALTCRVAADVPIIQTDASKLQQILYNLLSNAIKFTPPGGAVTVAARRSEQYEGVIISVADTGPGISAADQVHIFEKFYQLDRSVTREHGGAGLGLAIVKELTALLGGQLALDSEPGQGATFKVTLPLAIPQPAQRNGQPSGQPHEPQVERV